MIEGCRENPAEEAFGHSGDADRIYASGSVRRRSFLSRARQLWEELLSEQSFNEARDAQRLIDLRGTRRRGGWPYRPTLAPTIFRRCPSCGRLRALCDCPD